MSKWMVSADQLDDEQRDFLFYKTKEQRNMWISGFAGSGKSVLLMHTLASIKEKDPHASVLIVYFTHSLKQMFIVGMNELKINQLRVSFSTYVKYQKNPQRYDYILCDEVQDLTPEVLALLKSNCSRLYVSGDPNQSIYDKDPSTGRDVVKVDQIGLVTESDEYKLTTIYRLTQSVVKLISSLLPSMNMFKAKTNAKKVDVTARVALFNNPEDEVKYICERVTESLSVGESCVIILPTHNDIVEFARVYAEMKNTLAWKKINNDFDKPDFEKFNAYYDSIKLHVIGNGYGDLWNAHRNEKIVLMTYHSSKGLDFDNVYLPFLNIDAKINSDTLFMVGISRSKNSLTFSYTDQRHKFLDAIYNDCHDISNTINSTSRDSDDFDFDF